MRYAENGEETRLPPLTMTLEEAFGSVKPLYAVSVEEAIEQAREEHVSRRIEKMRAS